MRLAPDGGHRPREGEELDPRSFPRDAIKHETLFKNQPVSAAGEIVFEHGEVVDLNNFSGTYNVPFDRDFKGAVLQALDRSGIRVSHETRKKLM